MWKYSILLTLHAVTLLLKQVLQPRIHTISKVSTMINRMISLICD